MVHTPNTVHSLGDDIGLMTQIRQTFAAKLETIEAYLKASEQENEHHSGRLSLDNDINMVHLTSAALRAGQFKIAVVGDMKRGKSTILNVLLGSNFLPVDVTRCTAVLTVVRYGDAEKVTVHYTPASKRLPETLTTQEFKERFTLKPEIHRAFEELGQHAFPDVEYAEIETPNAFLEKGVQIIDTPGLNDTPELNQLTLEFAKECNAILFVLNPQTMVTMQEKQYFEAHFAGRGLPVFFLVNRWDQIRHQLMDPDDPEEVHAAEEGVRRQIRSNVLPLLAAGDGGSIEERMHELSSLLAWKRIVKNPGADLEGTGFEGFYSAIGKFLKEGRIRAEMRSSRILAANTYREYHRKVVDRIGMVSSSRGEFEENYNSVKGIFDHLRTIREQVRAEFEKAETTDSRLVASSLGNYIRGLGPELKSDFEMPELTYWQTIKMIQPSEQQKFTSQLKDAYAKFFQQKLPVWERNAEEMIGNNINRLQMVTEGYAVDYAVNINAISQRLSGGSLMEKTDLTADDSPWWTRAVAGGAAFMMGDYLGAGMAAHKMFNWKDVAKNVATLVAGQVLFFLITGGIFGPLGVLVVTVVVGLFNARNAVERLKERVTDALVKDLPNVAATAEEEANRHIREIYKGAQGRVLAAIDADILSRQQEIDNLRESMQKRDIDKEVERRRLLDQDTSLLALVNELELTEDRCLRAL